MNVPKIDSTLHTALQAWRERPEGTPDSGISVTVSFRGDLSAIEALGFDTHSVFGDQALGVILFKDIPVVAAHPDVLGIAAGRQRSPTLDTAARDIRARASAPVTGAPVDGLWHADIDTGFVTRASRATGKGVIVAIIDTGIDYTHPMFLQPGMPEKTRILRIWDQGLPPSSINDCPAVALLASSQTYGVEYDSAEIEADFSGGPRLEHRDCEGHGTHVAGIAAGGAMFAPFTGDATIVGIAPDADIIAVKYFDNPDKIFFRLPDGSAGAQIPPGTGFLDAVMYCLNVARELGKPVVINMSFGSNAEPGDGLDVDARLIDAILDPNAAPGPNNFPNGAIVVKAAGNEGDWEMRKVVRIVIPASGEVVVPLEFKDLREGTQTAWINCAQRIYKPDVRVDFWYRRTAAPLAVDFAVRLPHGSAFSSDVSVGGELKVGILRKATGEDEWAVFNPTNHRLTIEHLDPGPTVHPSGALIHRHHVRFVVSPKDRGGLVSYHTGIYQLRIRAPEGTELFAMCGKASWGGDQKWVTFRVAVQMEDGSPVDLTNIQLTSEWSAVDTLGQHVITVASYNDTDGNTTHPEHHHIAESSSRGPLRNYSDPANPVSVFPKPDIAAPGVKITSAESYDTEGLFHAPWWYFGDRYMELGGTSMASPMIAGVVALLLEKNPNLNTTQVRNLLIASARAAVEPADFPAAERAYGAGMVDALNSHINTP